LGLEPVAEIPRCRWVVLGWELGLRARNVHKDERCLALFQLPEVLHVGVLRWW
jgi:hypothetical protein